MHWRVVCNCIGAFNSNRKRATEMSDPDFQMPFVHLTDEERYPLASFSGASPPAPQWYHRICAKLPERTSFAVEGRAIELLTWGKIGNPGLLFLHGMSASADWWVHIAPWFAEKWRCAAISFSGMGGSKWTEGYSLEGFAEEARAAIGAARLDEGPDGVVVIGHSFGGNPAMIAGSEDRRISGVVCIDTDVATRWGLPPADFFSPTPHRVYPTLAAALARFRLDPPQTAENTYLVDQVARAGLRQTEEGGWTWRFDHKLWSTLDRSIVPYLPERVSCPMAYLYGDRSSLVDEHALGRVEDILPKGTPIIPIADAAHHVMIDQPLALVAALQALLATWPGSFVHMPEECRAAASRD